MGRFVRVPRFRAVGLLLLLAALLTPVLPAQSVRAATVTVTMTDANSGGNSDVIHSSGCASNGTAPCSLRDAVLFNDANPGATINVPAGTYTLTHSTGFTGSGLELHASTTIIGAGAGSTIIQASATPNAASYRVLYVNGGNITLQGVTIRNGVGYRNGGGGIYVDSGGTLTLANSTLSGNSVAQSPVSGGGILNNGTLTITGSTITGNSASYGGIGWGGGIFVSSGTLTVTNSTLSGNSAGVAGGAIFGTLTATNSTFSGNTAGGSSGGGGIDGGGILTNTIVANSTNGDLSGTFTGNNNLIDDSTIGNLTGSGNINQPAQLGPLQYNGGPTQTMAPALNSPAVDAIPPANCAVTTDQRDTPRPQGANCDIGAVEILIPSLTLNPASGAPGSTVTFSGADFRTGLTLTIDGVPATVGTVAADGTSFTATMPSPHASGPVSMTVRNPDTTTASATFTYTSATLTSIAITPTNPSIAKGTAQQFTATGTYSDTTTADITHSVTWNSNNTAAATINATGLATGVGVGNATISAALGGVTSNNATLTVTAATLTSIAVTPANPQIANGTSQQFTATGTFSDGTHQDLTASVTWASNNTGVATIANAAGTQGLATGAGAGTTTISATLGDVTGSTSLAVTDATLVSIAVTPGSASIAKGTSQQFIATGTFSDGSTQDLTSSVTWSATGGTGSATISNTAGTKGRATGTAPGSGITITAAFGGTSGTATLAVTAATLTSIVVTPANPVIAKGTTRQFTATGTFSDGTTQDLTSDPALTWQSGTPGVATISSSGATKGLATAVSPGAAQITATRGGVTGGTTLTVTNAALTSIAVTPTSAGITTGATQQFTAIGAYSDDTTADLTSSVTWASSNPGVAPISNAVGSHGLAAAVAAGTTTITATQSGVTSDGATLTVTAPPRTLQRIAVTPANPTVKVGATVQMTATGTYSDGTTQNLTTQVQWGPSAGAVASVDAGGTVLGKSPGTVTITATLSGVTGQTQVTVGSGSGTGVGPAPAPAPRATGTGAGSGSGGNPPAPLPTGR